SNIGLHTGLLLENARSREDLIRSNRELDLKNSELTSLYEIGRSLKTSLEIDQLKDEFLRSIMRMLKLGYACLMEKSGENKGLKRSLACEMTSTGPVKLEAADAAEDLTGTTDIIAWMIENHEPFFFSGGENEAAGPIRRLQELNPEYFNSKCKPDIWIPIFSEDAKDIIYVLSISGISERSQKGRYNRAFFGSLMDQVQMAFYNAKIYREALEAKEKEESIRQSFQKYVPVKVVEEILNQSENPQLKTLNTTTMFLDIRNFTGISESIEPKELVELLNEFFEEMVDAVMIHNGTVDKFIGDAIMALFGVPDASEHDADNAILSAQEIFNRLSILNKKRLSENRIIFEVSMGIHTGPVVAGNVGSRKRMDYTVIGDAVNLASRIQKMYYLYKTPVIFTEDTLNMLKGEYSVREIDLIQVRGRTHSNKIYQLAENSMIADKFLEVHNVWINAIHEYRNKNIKEAQLLFQKSRTVYPEDPVCELYLKRCSRLLENPPDLSFDGIFKVDS
ncbi:MAG: adenylate/guanylate cyclase domain-containing protein, partial [Spirochaetia bacterium]|nr:adenylate/guanylate cyclase domain-containing protein [Spirochaetia bacterium]